MDLNSNGYANRIKIAFYSFLISVMGLVKRFQFSPEPLVNPTLEAPTFVEENNSLTNQEISAKPFGNFWTRISQAFISFIIWMVLGFAAGYLIGMIKPG